MINLSNMTNNQITDYLAHDHNRRRSGKVLEQLGNHRTPTVARDGVGQTRQQQETPYARSNQRNAQGEN